MEAKYRVLDKIHKEQLKEQAEANQRLMLEKRSELLEIHRYNQITINQGKTPPILSLGKHSQTTRFTKSQLEIAASKLIRLVPIRLDVEHDGIKIRDTFTWNLNENVISKESFAKQLCIDAGFRVPTSGLIGQIVRSLGEQIDDFFQHAPDSLDNKEYDVHGNNGHEGSDKDLPELRIIIKLDITIDQQCIVDQFEWDIGCNRNSPEGFAEMLVEDLGLVPEFKYGSFDSRTAIAHSIREQIQCISKSLLIANHNFSRDIIPTEELSAVFLAPLRSVMRFGKDLDSFGPIISQASAVDIEKLEKDLDRESRRKRRQTARSRRVASLPERETSKVTRTTLPYPIKFEATNPLEASSSICINCKRNAKAAAEDNCISCAAFMMRKGYLPGEEEMEVDQGEEYLP